MGDLMKGKGDAGSQRSGGNNGEDPEQDGATGAASVPPSSSASTGSPSDPSVTRASVATSTLQLDAIRTSSGKGEEVERLQDHLLALQQELQARQRESLELTEQLDEMAASFAESTSGIASLAEAEEQMFRPISDAEVAAVVERYLKSGENGAHSSLAAGSSWAPGPSLTAIPPVRRERRARARHPLRDGHLRADPAQDECELRSHLRAAVPPGGRAVRRPRPERPFRISFPTPPRRWRRRGALRATWRAPTCCATLRAPCSRPATSCPSTFTACP